MSQVSPSQRRTYQTREIDSDIHTFETTILKHTSDGMDCVIGVISNIMEFLDGDEELKSETMSYMDEFIAMETEVKQHTEALKHVKSVAASLEDGETLKSEFDKQLQKLRKAKSPKAADHPKYKKMLLEVDKGGNIDEQLDRLRSSLLGDTQDDDIDMTDTEVNIKCPYTGQNMTDPVRNRVCNHVYDREGIMGHIRVKKKKAKCPVGGCGNPDAITANQLEDHTEMKRYIQLLNKRNK